MKSVDVVIPNYNYGRYLRACVDSVLSQDVEKLRVLIIDNASTDDSPEVARELAAMDPRVELRLRETNLRPARVVQRRDRLGGIGLFPDIVLR